jgi:cytoskeletal protein CcmA (bactofilin family)
MRRGIRRFLLLLILMSGISLAVPASVYAMDVWTDEHLVIEADEVVADDLYAFARTVTIQGTVQGDLIVFANRITINGRVEGDLMGAAEVIHINGVVTDDMRIAGQAIVLEETAQVQDDAFVAAYLLENRAGSRVGGNLAFATAQTLLAGEVAESVWGSATGVRIDGVVGKDVTLDFTGVEPTTIIPTMPSFSGNVLPTFPVIPVGLTVNEGAKIEGQLHYTSTMEAAIDAALTTPPVRTVPPVTSTGVITPAPVVPATSPAVTAFFDYVRRVTALLLAGLVLLGIRSTWVQQRSESVRTHYVTDLVRGLVAYIAFFVVAVLLFFVVIGVTIFAGRLTLGAVAVTFFGVGAVTEVGFILSFLLLVNFVAQVIMSVMIGRWLLARWYPAWAGRPIAQLSVGVLLIALLEAIPFVGGLVGLLIVLPVLGDLWEWGRTSLQSNRPTPTSTPMTPPQTMAPAGVA